MSGPAPDRSRALAIGSNLAADVVAANVVGELERRGIRTILLRGPAIARWLYQEGERSYYDVDLLIEPDAIASAQEALLILGFGGQSLLASGYGPPKHAELWVRGQDPPVDLHRTIIGVEASDRELWNAFAERTHSMALQGVDVKTLDRVGLLFVVTLHAAQHGHEAARHDLAVALARVGTRDWKEAASLAERVGALGPFVAGARLLPAGRQILGQLGINARPTSETLLRSEAAPDLSLGLNWMADLESVQARARFLISKLFPSPDYMRSLSGAARRGRVGLVTAYTRRIVWFVIRAPGAIRAVRSARRRAGGGSAH